MAEYEYLWPRAIVIDKFKLEAAACVRWAKEHRALFLEVTKATRVPWWVVAATNNLEMGRDFDGCILNGDPWNKVTVHYPKGHGPWKSWLDAAIWGLRYEANGWNFDLSNWRWDVPNTFYYAEAYNGFNARLEMGQAIVPPHASPYVYSGTQFYKSGKLTEVETAPGSGKYKGVFRPDLVSKQLGFMAFARALEDSGEKLF